MGILDIGLKIGELNNGSLSISLSTDDFGNSLFSADGVYSVELVKAGTIGIGDFAVCTSNQQVTVQGESDNLCTSVDVEPSSGPEGTTF